MTLQFDATDQWLHDFFNMDAETAIYNSGNHDWVPNLSPRFYNSGPYAVVDGGPGGEFISDGFIDHPYFVQPTTPTHTDIFGFSVPDDVAGLDDFKLNMAEHQLVSSVGGAHLYGQPNDLLEGKQGNDYLLGGKYLLGGDGNDTMATTTGNSLYWGGKGNDTYFAHPWTGGVEPIINPSTFMIDFNNHDASLNGHDTLHNLGASDHLMFNDTAYRTNLLSDLDKVFSISGNVLDWTIEAKNHTGGVHIQGFVGGYDGHSIVTGPSQNVALHNFEDVASAFGSNFIEFSHQSDHWWM